MPYSRLPSRRMSCNVQFSASKSQHTASIFDKSRLSIHREGMSERSPSRQVRRTRGKVVGSGAEDVRFRHNKRLSRRKFGITSVKACAADASHASNPSPNVCNVRGSEGSESYTEESSPGGNVKSRLSTDPKERRLPRMPCPFCVSSWRESVSSL